MNLFEVLNDAFKPFLDGEKKPLTVLEVSNLWFYLAATENTMRNEEIAYNVTQDKELKKKLKDAKEHVHQPIAKSIRELLIKEEVPLPQTTAEKPVGDYVNIPEGAKLTDEEIANLMSYNLLLGINYASKGITEAVRADVGLLFSKFLMKKITFSLTIKDLLKKRGWMRVPPYYKP